MVIIILTPKYRFITCQTCGLIGIDRLFDKKLEFYLRSVGAVQIVGPKWCGKSRTARRYAKTAIFATFLNMFSALFAIQ